MNGMEIESSEANSRDFKSASCKQICPPESYEWFKLNKFSDRKKEEKDEAKSLEESESSLRKSIEKSKLKTFFVKQKCLNNSKADVGDRVSNNLDRQNARKSNFFAKIKENVESAKFKKRKTVQGAQIIMMRNRIISSWLQDFREKRKWRNPENLTNMMKYLLGEKLLGSSDVDHSFGKGQQKASFQKNLGFLIHHFLKKGLGNRLPVINPESRYKILWNILLCFCIPYQIFFLTIEIFFDSNWKGVYGKEAAIFNAAEQILRILFFFDVLLSFFTGFYERGMIIYNKKKILRNYIYKFLPVDVITLVPLFIDSLPSTILLFSRQSVFFSLIRLLFVFRLLILSRTFNLVEQILSNRKNLEVLLALIKLSLYILGTAHMLACMWYFIGLQSMKNKYSSWVNNPKICPEGPVDCDWRTYYIYSLYWAITTMITVGYGDITPTNEMEIVYCLLSMLFGCGMFGYSINQIGIVFEKLRANEKSFLEKMKLINGFMNREQVDFDLQVRVRRYLEYIFMEAKNEKSEEEQKIVRNLSTSLRRELLMQTNGKLLMRNPIFANHFSKSTIEKLSDLFVQQDFAHEEIIFEENSCDNEKLYFISKGRVDTFIACDNGGASYIRLNTLEQGSVFGEVSFITSSKQIFSAVSVGYTRVFYVNKANFIETLREEPEDYERFCLIRDKLISYKNSEDFYNPCFCCNKIGHLFLECPLTHYQPNKLNVILKVKRDERRVKARKRSKLCNTMKNLKLLQDSTQEFRRDNDMEEESNCEEISVEEVKGNECVSSQSQNSKDVLRLGSLIESERQNMKSTKGLEQEPSKFSPSNFLTVDGATKSSLGFQTAESLRKEESPSFTVPFEGRQATYEISENIKIIKPEEEAYEEKIKLSSTALNMKVDIDIDRVKDFKTYFPYNNCMKILRKLNEKPSVYNYAKGEIIADNRKMIQELLELHKNYSNRLYVSKRKNLDKSKLNFKENII